MNKKELYKEYKVLKEEQLRDALFHSQEIQELEKVNQELKKDIDRCLKYINQLNNELDDIKDKYDEEYDELNK